MSEGPTQIQAPPLAPGQEIAGLRLGGLLGRGAMGEVYRGEQIALGRPVAIKRIADSLAGDPDAMQRFAREARLVASVQHQHVLVVHDLLPAALDAAGRAHALLVMELVDGATNAGAWCQSRAWSEQVRLLAQAARGLAAVHGHGIIHRDIKPDNILVTRDGQAKLGDFGLARQEQGTMLTMAGSCMGTPAYMSPEACGGALLGPASDIYSFGASLYHILAGQPVFSRGTHMAVMHAHCYDPIPSLRELRPELPTALTDAVAACLDKDPHRRPTAEALAAALERALATPEARSAVPRSEAPTLCGPTAAVPVAARRKGPVIAIVAVVVLAGGAGLGVALMPRQAAAPPAGPGPVSASAAVPAVPPAVPSSPVAAPLLPASPGRTLDDHLAMIRERLAAGDATAALAILRESLPLAERSGQGGPHRQAIERLERTLGRSAQSTTP